MVNLLQIHFAKLANLGNLRTRTDFRNAQLQAKRNAELAKRKEKDILLSRSCTSEQKQPSEKLTHDDLVLNASNDVTSALRRTHQLMQSELSRSQFAQETLGGCFSFSHLLEHALIALCRSINGRNLITIRVL